MNLLTRIALLILVATISVAPTQTCEAQKKRSPKKKRKDDKPLLESVTYSDPVKAKIEFSAVMLPRKSDAQNVLMTIPLPNNWPEQSVSIVKESIPTEIGNVTERFLEHGVRQMVIRFAKVNKGQKVSISFTLEVNTSQVNPPLNTTPFLIPKSSHRKGRKHMGVSTYVNFKNTKLRKHVKEVIKDKSTAWEKVEAIYDWVRDNTELEDTALKDAQTTFKERKGDSESRVFLFVAMCRNAKVPARIVYTEGMYYAEFMLTDEKGKTAYWFPCNINGLREFGEFSEPKIIIQKGDNIRVPEKKQRQKLVAEFLTCQGKARPTVKFASKILDEDD